MLGFPRVTPEHAAGLWIHRNDLFVSKRHQFPFSVPNVGHKRGVTRRFTAGAPEDFAVLFVERHAVRTNVDVQRAAADQRRSGKAPRRALGLCFFSDIFLPDDVAIVRTETDQ